MKREQTHGGKNHPINGSFEKNVLLSLFRQFNENEAIKLAEKRIKELETELKKTKVENGTLISHNQELEDEIAKIARFTLSELQQWKFDRKYHEETVKLERQMQNCKKECNKAIQDKKHWENMCYKLLANKDSNEVKT